MSAFDLIRNINRLNLENKIDIVLRNLKNVNSLPEKYREQTRELLQKQYDTLNARYREKYGERKK